MLRCQLCRAREEAKVEPYSEIYEEEPTPFDEMYKEASVFGSEVCSHSLVDPGLAGLAPLVPNSHDDMLVWIRGSGKLAAGPAGIRQVRVQGHVAPRCNAARPQLLGATAAYSSWPGR